jgi:hypothetical protein
MPVMPPPTAQELPPEKGGCMRTGLIGCGIVALLCVLIFVGGVLYVKKNPGAVLDFAVASIEKKYGPDVTEEDRKELRAVVADVKEAARSGRIRSNRSVGWQNFSKRGSDKLSHEDVQEIIRTFRETILPLPGGAAAPPAVTMVPMAEPTRSP